MFIERDFQVKQAQIDDELRRRELERQLSPPKPTSRTRTFRRTRQLARQPLLVGRHTIPATTPEAS